LQVRGFQWFSISKVKAKSKQTIKWCVDVLMSVDFCWFLLMSVDLYNLKPQIVETSYINKINKINKWMFMIRDSQIKLAET
jgi:hypothetical protein